MPAESPGAATSSGTPQRRRFLFGEFELDLDRGSLTCRGKEIALRPKSFTMLRYLVEHAGQLVSREELLDAVWPDVVVSDGSINQCLIELRRALGDDERSMIRTVPRRGLIFDVPVRLEAASEPPSGPAPTWLPRRRWQLGAALAAVAIVLALWWGQRELDFPPVGPERNSIAVLRFTDMSVPDGRSYLADGFSEEIIHMLAQSPSLDVIARTSAFSIEDQPIDVVASRLGVSHVLEGSLRRQDDEIRVTAQLIDASTGTHLWSRSFDRDLDHLIDVQKEIAGAVAGTLEASLGDVVDTPAVDPRAYELFLEARFFYSRRAEGDLLRAEQRLEEALALQPDFARAWAELAAVTAARSGDPSDGFTDPELTENHRVKQEHAVRQALKYGPGLPESHHRAGQFYFYNGQRGKAREHLERVRSLDPDHGLVLVAQAHELRNLGRAEESSEVVRRNLRTDPINTPLRANLIADLFWAGQFDDVGQELEKMIDLSPSVIGEAPFVGRIAAQAAVLEQDFDAAMAIAGQMPEGPERLQVLALVRHGRGEQAASDSAVSRLEALAGSVSDSEVEFLVAEIHAYRGEPDEALYWLQRIDLQPDCRDDAQHWAIYYSPFLGMLGEEPAWREYRSSVLELMSSCLLGLVKADGTP